MRFLFDSEINVGGGHGVVVHNKGQDQSSDIMKILCQALGQQYLLKQCQTKPIDHFCLAGENNRSLALVCSAIQPVNGGYNDLYLMRSPLNQAPIIYESIFAKLFGRLVKEKCYQQLDSYYQAEICHVTVMLDSYYQTAVWVLSRSCWIVNIRQQFGSCEGHARQLLSGSSFGSCQGQAGQLLSGSSLSHVKVMLDSYYQTAVCVMSRSCWIVIIRQQFGSCQGSFWIVTVRQQFGSYQGHTGQLLLDRSLGHVKGHSGQLLSGRSLGHVKVMLDSYCPTAVWVMSRVILDSYYQTAVWIMLDSQYQTAVWVTLDSYYQTAVHSKIKSKNHSGTIIQDSNAFNVKTDLHHLIFILSMCM